MNAPERRFHRTMCPMNCHPTLCGMKVETEGDRLVAITGDETHPDSHGFLCIRGESAHQIIGNPKRLLKPLIRRQRGADDGGFSPQTHDAPPSGRNTTAGPPSAPSPIDAETFSPAAISSCAIPSTRDIMRTPSSRSTSTTL